MTKVDRERMARVAAAAELKGRLVMPGSAQEGRYLWARLRSGEFVSPAPGMYARRAYWDSLDPAARALHLIFGYAERHPCWTFSSFSAALLYGLEVSYSLLDDVHVQASRGSHAHRMGRVVTHADRFAECYRVRGVRTVEMCETLMVCMRDASFGDAVAIVDSALRKGFSKEQMQDYLDRRCRGRKGVRRARAVLDFADGRAESGGESLARVAMARLGFAAPELQVEVADPLDPQSTYRCDYFWRLPQGGFLAGELDGVKKYRDERILNGRTALDVMTKERRRESRLTLYRMPIVRFSLDEVRDEQWFESLLDGFGVPRDERQKLRVLD